MFYIEFRKQCPQTFTSVGVDLLFVILGQMHGDDPKAITVHALLVKATKSPARLAWARVMAGRRFLKS